MRVQFTFGVSLIVCGSWAADVRYTIQDVGPVGTASQAWAISNDGYVAGKTGYYYNVGQAFMWNGSPTMLPNLGWATDSMVRSINSSHTAVGWSSNNGWHPTMWRNGTVEEMVGPGWEYGQAMDINEAGQVTGYVTGSFGTRPFLYQDGNVTMLPSLGASSTSETEGFAINNSGVIVGYSEMTSGPFTKAAFRWQNGVMEMLPGLPGVETGQTSAYGINDAGVICGWHFWLGRADAVVWQNGTAIDVPSIYGTANASLSAINNLNQAVGSSDYDIGFDGYAMLWDNGQSYDLNTLIAPNSGWLLHSGRAINDVGQITGIGRREDGLYHSFLLTPVPEPASMLALAGGMVGLARRRKPRNR